MQVMISCLVGHTFTSFGALLEEFVVCFTTNTKHVNLIVYKLLVTHISYQLSNRYMILSITIHEDKYSLR